MKFTVEENVPLAPYSTFKIGGSAKYFTKIHSIEQMVETMAFVRENQLPFFILGNGSNILFDDRGFNGLVIHNRILHCEFDKNRVHCGAGYNYSLLGSRVLKRKLSGLTFAIGIPGSVGGAVYMNAGAFGTDTFSVLDKVTFIDIQGNIRVYEKAELEHGYRYSIFQNMKGVILSAEFILHDFNEEREKQLQDMLAHRFTSQPYKHPSAGCIFQNPKPDMPASLLIDQLQLKGKKIGGAKVSEKHANFIVNDAQATSKDVLALIEHVKEVVAKHKDIQLNTEVRYLPYQNE